MNAPDGMLFTVAAPPPPPPAERVSADRRRTMRQVAVLHAGQHPLSLIYGHLGLHAEAAPVDDRAAPGRRCGDCRFLRRITWHNGTYSKCAYPDPEQWVWPRSSHGAATDTRGWWPGCTDHQYKQIGTDLVRIDVPHRTTYKIVPNSQGGTYQARCTCGWTHTERAADVDGDPREEHRAAVRAARQAAPASPSGAAP